MKKRNEMSKKSGREGQGHDKPRARRGTRREVIPKGRAAILDVQRIKLKTPIDTKEKTNKRKGAPRRREKGHAASPPLSCEASRRPRGVPQASLALGPLFS